MALVVSARFAEAVASNGDSLRDGDLVFQTSTSSQSKAIQLATHSSYSHVGIVFRETSGWQVWEAEGRVVATPWSTWVARGVEGSVAVRRLEGLTAAQRRALRQAARWFRGKPYDPFFGWSDDRLYCSEFVWKVFHNGIGVDLSPLRRLREFDLEPAAVRKKLRERYGERIPLDEPVVAPSDLFGSALLTAVPQKPQSGESARHDKEKRP